MKLTRQELRKIIAESIINEGIFEPSVAGSAARFAGTGLGLTAGGTIGAVAGIPVPVLGPLAGGATGATTGAITGHKMASRLADKYGYLSGDIPFDHPLHPNNIFQKFQNREFNSAQEVKKYIDNESQGRYTVKYYSTDFPESQLGKGFVTVLSQIGHLKGQIGQTIDDITMFKGRATDKAVSQAKKSGMTLYDKMRGYFSSGDSGDDSAVV